MGSVKIVVLAKKKFKSLLFWCKNESDAYLVFTVHSHTEAISLSDSRFIGSQRVTTIDRFHCICMSFDCSIYIIGRYTGMLEAVRVRREGFSYRPYFSDFFNSYRCLAYYFTDTVMAT